MARSEDSREKERTRVRSWHVANPERVRAHKRAWYERNRENVAESKRASRAANPEKAKEASRKAHAQQRENSQRYGYNHHKDSAKRRNIEFLLSFEEWWTIWLESGRWEHRGIHRGEYCMARHGDTGAYATGNVRICTNEENKREAHRLRRGKPMSINRLETLARARAAWWKMEPQARKRKVVSDKQRAAAAKAREAKLAKAKHT